MVRADGVQRVTIVGDGMWPALDLAKAYETSGAAVRHVDARGMSAETVAEKLGQEPIDILVFADIGAPPTGPVADLVRCDLAAELERLTFMPFRIAVLLRPALAATDARLVLLTRQEARMEAPDPAGRYLDRPFRAAAHALWRCLSIEWRGQGIACAIIALDENANADVLARIPETIEAARPVEPGVELTDAAGRVLGW